MSSSESHAVVVTVHGEVYGVGDNRSGQLGLGHRDVVPSPTLLSFFKPESLLCSKVTCGASHCAFLVVPGRLFVAGCGTYGRLGLGSEEDALIPKEVLIKTSRRESSIMPSRHQPEVTHHLFADVACGTRHTIAVTQSQPGIPPVEPEVYSWGDGGRGRLGLGDEQDALTPTVVGPFDPNPRLDVLKFHITSVAAGDAHSAALSNRGELYTWGCGLHGKLGHGKVKAEWEPQLVEALNSVRVSSVSLGDRHTLAVDSDGKVHAWGDSSFGRLGIPLPTGDLPSDVLVPTRVRGLVKHKVLQVSAGPDHSAAIDKAGNLYTWGEGSEGRLGHPEQADVYQPRKVDLNAAITGASGLLSAAAMAAVSDNPGQASGVRPAVDTAVVLGPDDSRAEVGDGVDGSGGGGASSVGVASRRSTMAARRSTTGVSFAARHSASFDGDALVGAATPAAPTPAQGTASATASVIVGTGPSTTPTMGQSTTPTLPGGGVGGGATSVQVSAAAAAAAARLTPTSVQHSVQAKSVLCGRRFTLVDVMVTSTVTKDEAEVHEMQVAELLGDLVNVNDLVGKSTASSSAAGAGGGGCGTGGGATSATANNNNGSSNNLGYPSPPRLATTSDGPAMIRLSIVPPQTGTGTASSSNSPAPRRASSKHIIWKGDDGDGSDDEDDPDDMDTVPDKTEYYKHLLHVHTPAVPPPRVLQEAKARMRRYRAADGKPMDDEVPSPPPHPAMKLVMPPAAAAAIASAVGGAAAGGGRTPTWMQHKSRSGRKKGKKAAPFRFSNPADKSKPATATARQKLVSLPQTGRGSRLVFREPPAGGLRATGMDRLEELAKPLSPRKVGRERYEPVTPRSPLLSRQSQTRRSGGGGGGGGGRRQRPGDVDDDGTGLRPASSLLGNSGRPTSEFDDVMIGRMRSPWPQQGGRTPGTTSLTDPAQFMMNDVQKDALLDLDDGVGDEDDDTAKSLLSPRRMRFRQLAREGKGSFRRSFDASTPVAAHSTASRGWSVRQALRKIEQNAATTPPPQPSGAALKQKLLGLEAPPPKPPTPRSTTDFVNDSDYVLHSSRTLKTTARRPTMPVKGGSAKIGRARPTTQRRLVQRGAGVPRARQNPIELLVPPPPQPTRHGIVPSPSPVLQ